MSQTTTVTSFDAMLSIISKISMFGGIDERKLPTVLRFLEIGTFDQGETVFQKGDQPTHIYIVQSGKLDLHITDGDTAIEIKELGVGESFGEASLISMQKHTATAVAKEKCEIIMLSRHALIQFQQKELESFAILMMNIARDLARRLKLTDDILLQYVHSHHRD